MVIADDFSHGSEWVFWDPYNLWAVDDYSVLASNDQARYLK